MRRWLKGVEAVAEQTGRDGKTVTYQPQKKGRWHGLCDLPFLFIFFACTFVFQLLPLNCCWGFGGDVVADAVDALDVADDLVADVGKEVVGEFCPVGSHGIG